MKPLSLELKKIIGRIKTPKEGDYWTEGWVSLCPMKVAKVDEGSLSKGDSWSWALSPCLPFPPRIHLGSRTESWQHCMSFPGERAQP